MNPKIHSINERSTRIYSTPLLWLYSVWHFYLFIYIYFWCPRAFFSRLLRRLIRLIFIWFLFVVTHHDEKRQKSLHDDNGTLFKIYCDIFTYCPMNINTIEYLYMSIFGGCERDVGSWIELRCDSRSNIKLVMIYSRFGWKKVTVLSSLPLYLS